MKTPYEHVEGSDSLARTISSTLRGWSEPSTCSYGVFMLSFAPRRCHRLSIGGIGTRTQGQCRSPGGRHSKILALRRPHDRSQLRTRSGQRLRWGWQGRHRRQSCRRPCPLPPYRVCLPSLRFQLRQHGRGPAARLSCRCSFSGRVARLGFRWR